MLRPLVLFLLLSCNRSTQPAFGAGAPAEETTPLPTPIFSVTAAPAKPVLASRALAVCPSACSASSLPQPVLQELSSRAKSSRKCYQRTLAKDPSLSIRATLTLRMNAEGQPCDVRIVGTDDPEFSECIAEVFRYPRFPAPGNACAEVNVPLVFVPSNGPT